MDNFRLYTATTEKLPVLISVEINFVKNTNKLDPCRASTFYTSTEMFLVELSAVFGDQQTDSTPEIVEFLNAPMYHTCTTNFPRCRCFTAACVCVAMTQVTRKELRTFGRKVISARLS